MPFAVHVEAPFRLDRDVIPLQRGSRMKHRTAVLAGALLLVGASPTFVRGDLQDEAEGDTVVVYSTAKKDEACYSMVTFSYKSGDEREVRIFVCNGFARGWNISVTRTGRSSGKFGPAQVCLLLAQERKPILRRIEAR